MAFLGMFRFDERLPTPPREHSNALTNSTLDAAIQYLDDSLSDPLDEASIDHAHIAQSSLETPPDSSPINNRLRQNYEQPPPKSKRLRFSAEISLCEAEIKPLPPSREQNATKSILKASEIQTQDCNSNLVTGSSFPDANTDFPSMLEFLVKELASRDQASQNDAYVTLYSAIKHHEDHPDSNALLKKRSLLEDFMKRDITNGSIESSSKKLKFQALQLAITLIWKLPPSKDSTANTNTGVSHEFIRFLADRTLALLEDVATPKDILRHHLQVLTMREVWLSTLTSEFATKVLKSLRTIHERVTGNSMKEQRVMIYRQIAESHPPAIVEGINLILPNIVQSLCSRLKNLRTRAIETGIIVGTRTGHRRRVAHSLRDIMQSPAPESDTYTGCLEKVLESLMENQQEASHVPQIWGLIMLLLRGDSTVLREWLARKTWRKFIERCFNSSDTGLNRHAWVAWNRAIYAFQDVLVGEQVLDRLCRPHFAFVERGYNEAWKLSINESTLSGKDLAYSSYYLILYYAFRRQHDSGKTKAIWDQLVGGMCCKLVDKPATERHRFALALRALFAESTLKVFETDRALDTVNHPVKWQEIPRLDPGWIRRHCSHILKTLQPLLSVQPGPIDASGLTLEVWTSLLRAISQAGEKEIKASSDFRSAVATILNYLNDFWMTDPDYLGPFDSSNTAYTTLFLNMARSVIQILGPLHCGESILFRAASGIFEATNTPSTRNLHSSGSSQHCSTIAAIFGILWTPTAKTAYTPTIRAHITAIVEDALAPRATCWSKLELICDCAAVLAVPIRPNKAAVVAPIWQVLGSCASSVIKDPARQVETDSVKYRLYQRLIGLLKLGLNFADFKSQEVGRSLFHNMCSFTKAESGDASYVHSFALPWLRILTEDESTYNNRALLLYLTHMLNEQQPNPSAKALEQVRASTVRIQESNLSQQGWPRALFSACKFGLVYSYSQLESLDPSTVNDFLGSVSRTLQSMSDRFLGPVPAILPIISDLQEGLLAWIQDKDHKILKCQSRGFDTQHSFDRLWKAMLTAMVHSALSDLGLRGLEEMLIAGLRSKHKMFANSTIAGWNQFVDKHERLECPERLTAVLTRLQAYADVGTTSKNTFSKCLSTNDLPSEDAELFEWLRDESSQRDLHIASDASRSRNLLTPRYRKTTLISPSPANRRKATPRTAKTPPRRLRHDDSQVQFVAIDSSPLNNPADADSQNLTEHQKDVRFRQKADVPLFSDLGSTPSPGHRREPHHSLMQEREVTGGILQKLNQAAHDDGESSGDMLHESNNLVEDKNETPFVGSPQRNISASGEVGSEENMWLEQNRAAESENEPAVITSGSADGSRHPSPAGEIYQSDLDPSMNEQSAGYVTCGDETLSDTFLGINDEPSSDPLASGSPKSDHPVSDPTNLDDVSPLPRDSQQREATSSRILQELSPNACETPQLLTEGDTVDTPLKTDVDRIEESFVGSTMARKQSLQEEDVSLSLGSSAAIESPPVEESGGQEKRANNATLAVVIPAPSSVLSEGKIPKRGRKRKASTEDDKNSMGYTTRKSARLHQNRQLQGIRVKDELQLSNSDPHDTEVEDDGDIIIVKPRDENSPSIKTVLERKGILVPRTPGSPLSQATSKKRRRSQQSQRGPRKRRSTLSQEESIQNTNDCENGEDAMEMQDAEQRRDERAAEIVSFFDHLKAIIRRARGLDLGRGQTSIGRELVELGTELQREIKRAVGFE